MTQSEFGSRDIIFGSGEYPRDIYVVVGDGFKDKNIDMRVSMVIYVKRDNRIDSFTGVRSDLDLDASTKIIAGIRAAGYMVTVPMDVATAPLLMSLIILGGLGTR